VAAARLIVVTRKLKGKEKERKVMDVRLKQEGRTI